MKTWSYTRCSQQQILPAIVHHRLNVYDQYHSQPIGIRCRFHTKNTKHNTVITGYQPTDKRFLQATSSVGDISVTTRAQRGRGKPGELQTVVKHRQEVLDRLSGKAIYVKQYPKFSVDKTFLVVLELGVTA